MFEKVNPSHPDKIADRIAGALVDLAYKQEENPKIAVEVLIGHGVCHIISEVSKKQDKKAIKEAVYRITQDKKIKVDYVEVSQDPYLAGNQRDKLKTGDNGIFLGMPVTKEEQKMTDIAEDIYSNFPSDGKYVLDSDSLVVCQSNATEEQIKNVIEKYKMKNVLINPLGSWTGGTNVDTGATNRKLGSDMGRSATGGGLHGKDLSKADVSVNIYAFLKAQELGKKVEISCAIGDIYVDGKEFSEIVEIARDYIKKLGGFEKFAEWGLIR